MVKVRDNQCIYFPLVFTLFISQSTIAKDVETELLDKEYGVKYASACEGKFLI